MTEASAAPVQLRPASAGGAQVLPDSAPNPALAEMWRKYRGWAARARAVRADLDRWRLRVLALTVLGAVLATLAGQLEAWFAAWSDGIVARVLSGASAAAMALAAYAGRSMLDPALERQWLRARALAESCRSEAYRFATRVAPYDGAEAGPRLLAKLQESLASGADVPAVDVGAPEGGKDLPAYPLPVEDYATRRVREQIDGYYRPRAELNERRAGRCALLVQGLTGGAAVLGAIGAVHAGSGVEAWVASLGTVAAAIGAFALSQRYQRLAATYRVTADRLAVRLALWELARQGRPDPGADAALVLDAEAIMAAENEAWLAEFLKDPNAAATAAGS